MGSVGSVGPEPPSHATPLSLYPDAAGLGPGTLPWKPVSHRFVVYATVHAAADALGTAGTAAAVPVMPATVGDAATAKA
ncbi:hypothetical protein [Streptomyces sp. NPDC021212]|uniref:hypothetical protein n=1 Tax=Streptomyces sp. NPDC021212 TaxID=3365118 RepID=UPI0037A60BFB